MLKPHSVSCSQVGPGRRLRLTRISSSTSQQSRAGAGPLNGAVLMPAVSPQKKCPLTAGVWLLSRATRRGGMRPVMSWYQWNADEAHRLGRSVQYGSLPECAQASLISRCGPKWAAGNARSRLESHERGRTGSLAGLLRENRWHHQNQLVGCRCATCPQEEQSPRPGMGLVCGY